MKLGKKQERINSQLGVIMIILVNMEKNMVNYITGMQSMTLEE
jgi:hypothetical protein